MIAEQYPHILEQLRDRQPEWTRDFIDKLRQQNPDLVAQIEEAIPRILDVMPFGKLGVKSIITPPGSVHFLLV